MPILDAYPTPSSPMNPDLVPRPLVVFGASKNDMGGPGRREIVFHQHEKGQLLLLMRGVLECEVANGLWIVPPLSAIWVPGGVMHRITVAGAMNGYVGFVAPACAAGLPSDCCAVSATPLLRELLMRAATFPLLYPEDGMEARVVALLLDELALAPKGTLHLPVPQDARLRKIVDALVADPSDRGTMHTWAQKVGLSERTLARLLLKETGMSFGRWRQQLQLMLAVKWLSTGMSVQQVSDDLGYESAGSFVGMFRRAVGTSPGRYMAQRRG